ncbi:ATP synthase subunit b, partial [human gut metagenome]
LSTALAPAVLAASGSEGNILLPHSYDLVWGTIAFLLIAGLLIFFALPPFTAARGERTKKIEAGLALADKAKIGRA